MLRFRMSVPAASAPGRQVLGGGLAPVVGPAAAPPVNLSAVYRTEALRYAGATRALTAPSSEALARIANAPAPGLTAGSRSGTGAALGRPLNEALLGAHSTVPTPAPPTASNGKGQGSGTGGRGTSDLAVVGLNPSPSSDVSVPRGRRPGRFSAAPDGGDGNGRIGVPGVENGARVPNLSVSAARPGASLASVPTVVPGEGRGAWRDSEKPDGVLLALNRLTGPGSVEQLSAADLERAAKAPPELKERAPLEDRTVYTMAINMPNISSYQGSWIVRYAQLEKEVDETPFSAPAPVRKVDPKYVAQAALEGIEGEVLLYAVIKPDGGVDAAKVMRGIDDRLDQSALEAIRKWQFKPASRGGEPIAVEALFSIPFQLTGLKP
jgi:TonB family protein